MSEIATIYHSIAEFPLSLKNNPYEIHRLVWRAFPKLPKQTPQPFTFRLLNIKYEDNSKVIFLIQSCDEPDWSFTKKASGTQLLEPVVKKRYELQEGDNWQYKLQAAPIIKLKRDNSKNSQHVAIVSANRIWEWFKRRSSMHGFEADPFSTHFNKERVRIKNPSHGDFYLTRASFTGELTVVNSQSFKQALEQGVGIKKAYGFGMMNLLPNIA